MTALLSSYLYSSYPNAAKNRAPAYKLYVLRLLEPRLPSSTTQDNGWAVLETARDRSSQRAISALCHNVYVQGTHVLAYMLYGRTSLRVSTALRMSVRKQFVQRMIDRQTSASTITDEKKARLAVLDDYGGIAKKHFQAVTDLEFNVFTETLNPADAASLDKLAHELESYDIISTMRERTPFPASLLSKLPKLKLLLTTGVRNASLDLEFASERGIVIAGTTGAQAGNPDHSKPNELPPPPGYDSTTQHTWALLLSICARIPQDDAALRSNGKAWQSGYSLALGGKTFGACGLGKLGANAARIAVQAFGMRVIAWSNSLTQEKADVAAKNAGLPVGSFKAVSKEQLFREADVISLHYVLSDRSRGLIGSTELGMMKPTAILVNTSRGPLIDEQALLDSLSRGQIRGAALDVWWQEPLPSDSPWRGYNGKGELVMSPHMGYVNEGTMNRWYEEQAENVRRWLVGDEVLNKIN